MKLTVEIDTDDLEASDLSVIEFIYKHQKKRLRGASVAPAPSNGQRPSEGTPSKLQAKVANMRAA